MFDNPGAKLAYSQQLNSPPIDENITVKELKRVSLIKDNTIELFVAVIKKSKKDDVCCSVYWTLIRRTKNSWCILKKEIL